MESDKRIEKWDILKFFLIFCVVLGHIIQNFTNGSDLMNSEEFLIYTFHMPLFIFVSGLFSKRTVNEKRYDKIMVYLFLFFITKIILTVSRVIAYKEVSFDLFGNGGLPWYMLAIFAFMLITIALRKMSPVYVMILSVAVSCAVGLDAKIGDTLAIMRIAVFYPFFYAGYCFDQKAIVKFTDKKWVKTVSAVVVIAYAFIVFSNIDVLNQFRGLLTARSSYDTLEEYRDYGPLLRIVYYLIVFIIGTAIISLTPNRIGKKGVIAKLGSRSLQVYMLHYPFVHFVDGRLKDYVPNMHQTVPFIVSAVLITLFLSLKFWEPIFKALMNPFGKKSK